MTFFQIEKCIILYIAVLITLRIKWIFSLTVYMYMYEAPSLHFQTAKNSIKITHQQNVNKLHIVKGWETYVHYLKNIFKRFLRNLVVLLHLLLL